MKKRKTKPTGPRPEATRQASSRSRGIQKTPRRDSSFPAHRSKSPKNTALLCEQADLLQLTHDTLCVVVRNLDDEITFWSRGAEDQYGWTESEALSQRIYVLLQTEFPRPLEEIHAQLLHSGRWEGELAHTRRDGTRINLASRWVLQRDAQGQPVAILEINNDITERKRAEDEIRRLNQALQQHAQDLEKSNEALRVANEDLERQMAVRQQAEQALRHSEGRYHSLFENMLDGFAYCQLLYDDHGHPVDFVYLDVNAAFEALTGLKNVVGKKVTEVIPRIKEEHPELFEIYGRVALTGQPERFVLEFKPLAIWLSLSVYSPDRGYFVAVFENITERKRTQEFSYALNALNAVIHSTLDLDEIMQRAMHEAARALGCDTAAISLREGDRWLVRYVHGFPKEVIGAQMNDDEERHAVLAIQTKKPVAVDDAFNDERVNREHMRKWGVRSVLVVPLIVKDETIGVMFFNYLQSAFTFRDAHIGFGTQLAASLSLALENARLFENLEKELAQRKVTEERILRLNEDLEQRAGELEVANEELERLATSLALDLRSPLVSLHSVSRLIVQDYGAQLPPQAQQLFQLIDANAEEMDQLTQGLLQLMRVTRQTLRKQELDPEETVRAALMELQPEYEGRQVEFTVGHLPTCRADPLLLKQVWVHLLSNALKFTRPREQARIEIGARPEGNRFVYSAKDNGVGFDMSYAGTIFRAFQRYHHAEDWGGSGVGLALVESIVRRHGGRVWAEGTVNEGATFYFTLG